MFVKKVMDVTEFSARDATKLRELLHPNHDNLPIGYSIVHARIEKGEASLPHRLKSSETYYILSGKGTMHIEGEAKAISQASVVFVPARATQYVINTGDEDLTFLCIVEPFWKEEEEDIL